MLYYQSPNIRQLLHEEKITNFDPHILLQLGPPSSDLSDSYKAAIKAVSLPIHSFTLIQISGHSVRLPIWVFDYWRKIKYAMEYRHQWKNVLEWLRGISESESMDKICKQVMIGLSHFPWNGYNCTVHDMTALLTESYLSDFHIDYALTKIFHHHLNHYGINVSNCHAPLTVSDLDSITTAYKVNIQSARAAHKSQHLLDTENKIISGHIHSVAGVLHLPNHWTSLVLMFKPPKILYGDSLGCPMPSKKASAFRRWMCHMLNRSGHQMPESDICIYPLQTMNQQDPNSCGLFALNAIRHHYLPHNTLLLQPNHLSVAHCRMEHALDHLQDGAVS
jgi:hypothetical protein